MKVFLGLLAFVALVAADDLREIHVQTSDCSDCGMTALGQLSAKVCGKGQATSASGICCVAFHMKTGQNDYEEGSIDIFAGPSALGECYNFDLGTLGSASDISMTVYHSGSDGGKFDWIQVLTSSNQIYRCQLGTFLDGTSLMEATGCTLQK
ncbi:hypothetical protein TCAL_12947 [Tigriopus californicus]|uniref:C6 domain-containing protein n=1 Tax=Tigriopus californicus TaxID=6832 RepID=A0A553PRG8_TIGCA|nr:hypothetical protein TCAL_12947 [Tigriopus californicus]